MHIYPLTETNSGFAYLDVSIQFSVFIYGPWQAPSSFPATESGNNVLKFYI